MAGEQVTAEQENLVFRHYQAFNGIKLLTLLFLAVWIRQIDHVALGYYNIRASCRAFVQNE